MCALMAVACQKSATVPCQQTTVVVISLYFIGLVRYAYRYKNKMGVELRQTHNKSVSFAQKQLGQRYRRHKPQRYIFN